MKDACRHKVEGELQAAAHHAMAGVAAALITDDVIRPTGQLVYDLALALVAPLSADDRHHGHGVAPLYVLVWNLPCWREPGRISRSVTCVMNVQSSAQAMPLLPIRAGKAVVGEKNQFVGRVRIM